MNIKSDIIAYGKGDRAAEMRLAAFVQECESKLDQVGLDFVVGLRGRIGSAALAAQKKISIELEKNKKCSAIKRQLREHLAQIDRLGFNTEGAREDRRWIPILKEAARLRWAAKPDQEMYNIDLDIRNKMRRAAQLGVKI